MDTKLIITVSAELDRRARERAALEGITLSEVIRQRLEEFADGQGKREAKTVKNKVKKFNKHNLTNKTRSNNANEITADLAVLTSLNTLADEIGKHWPEGVSAVEAIREGRREL